MIEKVIKIAKRAGEEILKIKKEGFQVRTKTSEFDFVTTADLKSEEIILRELKKEFPEDEIISEETDNKITGKNKRVWLVDPLDGTKEFKNGGFGFSVMIGLCVNGIPTLGVVYAPARDLLYYAEKGKGAFIEVKGKASRLEVSRLDNLENSRMVTRIDHGEKRDTDRLIESIKVKEKIPEGSIGLKLGLISSGKAEINIHTNRLNKWDTCAPQIILEEAGGKITDWKGKKLDYNQTGNCWQNSFIATNGPLHPEILRKVKEFNLKINS